MIGFLGPGSMGGAMVSTLLRARFDVKAFDVNEKNLDAVVQEGAVRAKSFEDVIATCDLVLLSLRSSEIFVEVAGKYLVPNARTGQVFVDLGTTVADEDRRINALLGKKGAYLLDAPVSGGRLGCATGSLHIFVGGDREMFRKHWNVLSTLGIPSHVILCGPSGSGQVAKAVNQITMSLVDAAHMEAIAFGVKAGVSPIALLHAVGGDSGFRKDFAAHCQKVVMGEGDDVITKYPEFKYFEKEADRVGFSAPFMRALYEFLKKFPEDQVDNMGRPLPALWSALMSDGKK